MASAYAFGPEHHELTRWTDERSRWGGAVVKRDEQVGLVARGRELAHIDEFLWQARRGMGGALALRGEPGVGKSALIEAAVARASEFRIVQIRGQGTGGGDVTPAEWPQPLSELARQFDVVTEPRLPTLALGSSVVPTPAAPPNAAAVVEAVTAVLRRMIEMTANPLLITVDDCQSLPVWFVDAVAHAVLAHLGDQPVSLVVAWRDTPHLAPFALNRSDLPQHRLGGLDVAQAARLLSWHIDQLPVDRVLTDLVAGTGGNPLALLDVCSRLTPEQLEGWHPLPDPLPIGDAVVEAFDVGRYLPPPTRRALAIAAVSRVPRDVLIAVLEDLGGDMDDLGPAIDAGIIVDRGRRVDFVHPLVRAASFHQAPADARRAARQSLSTQLARHQAIESSAFHAAADADGPDEGVTRRLAEAARVALERGDPAAAARHEEMAAQFAITDDAVAQHLAAASSLWMSAGQRERACRCLEGVDGRELGEVTGGELDYQLARLTTSADESEMADRMVAAAERCAAEAPHRALAMLIDAAAHKVLADDPSAGERLAERAMRLASTSSSHAEVLAGAVRSAAGLAGGRAAEDMADRTRVSLLIGQADRFPSSPEVALVIGRSLQALGMRRQADRWAQWIGWCAERNGDVALAAVPLLLQALAMLADGQVIDGAAVVEAAARVAERSGSPLLRAWGWSLSTRLHALTGDYESGFRDCAKLFAVSDRIGRAARLRAMPSLAVLELQQGRVGPALAWIRTAEEDLVGRRGPGSEVTHDAAVAEVGPELATVSLLARSPDGPERWAGFSGDGSVGDPGWKLWLGGACAEDPEVAMDHLSAAADRFDSPLVASWIDLCRAVRLAEIGRAGEARDLLDSVERIALEMGASGLAGLTANELDRLPPIGERATDDRFEGAGEGGARAETPPVVHEWDVSLLGDFAVRFRGKTVHLPPSLATQAVKIVALETRISVDELVELLWEDAEPGVGTRRLRNVLWRIRSSCGDLLEREGQFLRLADDAVTDLAQFHELAAQALAHGVPPERAASAARSALEHYRGELLPGDRYADWASAAREGASRTYVRLLDLLVEEALAGDRTSEALALLDRLAEADPYDERHYLQMAEIYLQTGNRRRALDALERAEHILEDLGVSPSSAVHRLRDALTAS